MAFKQNGQLVITKTPMDEYTPVNEVWPADLPSLTRDEARRAARKLIHHFGGRRRVRWVRRCWVAASPPFNTVHRGWRRLVHDVSHRVWTREAPKARAHGKHHATLELEMSRYVLARGWLTGTLKAAEHRRPAPTADQKLARTLAALKRWETKRRRAETAMKKLRRRVRYYERARVSRQRLP